MDVELPATEVTRKTHAVDFLADETGLSRQKIKAAMTKGAVWLEEGGKTKRLRRAKHQLKPGSQIALYYSEQVLQTEPAMPTLIADCKDYSVWIKPVGVMSGGSRYGDHCAIDRIVEKLWDRPTHLVHRLDRFVWGLMVLAHGKQTAAYLSTQFQKREISKTYEAIVSGNLTTPKTITTPLDGRDAHTHVTPLRQLEQNTYVSLSISTGRKHQIRRHLQSIGHPIVGDRLYGQADHEGIQLASVKLGFTSPVSQQYEEYELPEAQRPGAAKPAELPSSIPN